MIAEHELPLVEFTGVTLAVADLHLDPFDQERCQRFADWARGLSAGRLLILGDLFDAWVGPAHESAPGASLVIDCFRELSRNQCSVWILKGNRDFLLGSSFEQASGARVCPEGLIGELGDGTRVLFLHGDELCTRDLAYQRLRRVTHSRLVQVLGPRVPLFFSRRIAARLRRISRNAVARKPSQEKSIQDQAVRAFSELHGCSVLVCGHAHEARDRELEGGLRVVILDAFGDGPRDTLKVGAQSLLGLESSGL